MTEEQQRQAVAVADAPEHHRYEARIDSDLAGYAVYQLGEGQVVFTHTQVLPAFEGQGVGRALAAAALDDVRARGLRVVPLCPFIAAYIRRHREYADLL